MEILGDGIVDKKGTKRYDSNFGLLNDLEHIDEIRKEKLYKCIKCFVNIYNPKNKEKINNSQIEEFVNKFSELDDELLMDSLIFSLADWVKKGIISENDIYTNSKLILDIYPEKFKTFDDLKARYEYLKGLGLREDNMDENYKEKLKENHEKVIEVFDKFNKLICDLVGNGLDYFYTGGLVAYFGTNTELERYHTDIDIYLNEDDLEKLKTFIENNKDSGFKFIDNLKNKGPNGHEYLIKFGNNSVPIGIFLFKRLEDGKISRVEYLYNEKGDIEKVLRHSMNMETEEGNFNGTVYRRQSLKSVYDSKKDLSRSKDRHDAIIIKNYFENQGHKFSN